MSEFNFLLDRAPVPDHVQMLYGIDEVKKTIFEAIAEHAEFECILPVVERQSGKTQLIKVAKSGNEYYLILNPFKSQKFLKEAANSKYALFSCEFKGKCFGFLTKYVGFQKKIDKVAYSFPVRMFRIQRRKHFRAEIRSEHNLQLVLDMQGEERHCAVTDISEGGVGFVSKTDVPPKNMYGDTIQYNGTINVNGERDIAVTIEIRRVEEIVRHEGDDVNYLIGAQIMHIDYDDLDFLASYIFELQKEEALDKDKTIEKIESEVDDYGIEEIL